MALFRSLLPVLGVCLSVHLGLISGSAILGRQDPQIGDSLLGSWTHVGCFADESGNRILDGDRYSSDGSMTPDNCIAYCSQRGYSYAGVEYGKECWCDYVMQNDIGWDRDQSECNQPCTGDGSLTCGAGNRIDIYHDSAVTDPTVNRTIGTWQYQGCWADSTNARILEHSKHLAESLTPGGCIAACAASGYAVAGMEYSRECWCDKFVLFGNRQALPLCTMTCEGDHSQFCGGSGYLSMYLNKEVQFVEGCLTDTTRWKFTIQALYQPDGGQERWFSVKILNSGEEDKWILSTCDSCDGYTEFSIQDRVLYPEPRAPDSPIPVSTEPGTSPVFSVPGSTTAFPSFPWCPMMIPNFVTPLFGPPGLGVHNQVNPWYVCSTITTGSTAARIDVVYEPRADSLVYDFDSCLPVWLLMRFHN